ncbi:hypothetical protein GCM10009744_39410 [Kribbella alba]|uniref:VOC domain-containing protein n=1 Tax=Kribbella alba TaxID=190197 RepID=A0ABN2FH22_9ACTN
MLPIATSRSRSTWPGWRRPPGSRRSTTSCGADAARFGIATDDCRKTFDELVAKGVEYIQEPSDRPYGVEAVLRDNSGNWLVLVEQKPYGPDGFA